MFRSAPKLKTELVGEIARLQRDAGVRVRIYTRSFLAGESPLAHARQLATRTAADTPAAVLLYIRGSDQFALGTNASLEEKIPVFELAGIHPQDRAAPAANNSSGAATRLASAFREFSLVTRRYLQKDAGGLSTGSSKPEVVRSARAESFLAMAVIAVIAATFFFCARIYRRCLAAG